jgi:uncharacterized protein YndB with AHSA1/START domain
MSVRIQVPQVIDRPVEKVFHFYADDHIRNHPRWDPDMRLEQISEGPLGVGTVIRRRNTHTGTPIEGTMEIVEFEANKVFGVLIHDGSSVTYGRVTFEAMNEKQTTLTIHAEFPDLDESRQSWMVGMVERSARNIKQLIESET